MDSVLLSTCLATNGDIIDGIIQYPVDGGKLKMGYRKGVIVKQ